MNRSIAPEIAAGFVKSPSINPSPIAIQPHLFKKSTPFRTPGCDIIHFENPDNIHFDSFRKPIDDQFGISNFENPSNSKCQPINNLNPTSTYLCIGE